VLHEFISSNRTILIDRCRSMGADRSKQKTTEYEFAFGVPVFLDQLVSTLVIEQGSQVSRSVAADQPPFSAGSAVGEMAMLHGRELLEQGCTLEEVVRDYGDVCQAVTNLASEKGAPIAVEEFRTFNRCLDNAIVGAVTEYARHGAEAREIVAETLNSRLGPLAHELRNHLHTALLIIAAIKKGSVSISGATGAILDRSLLGMCALIDRALSEVRVTAQMPPRREVIPLAAFLANVRIAASFDALARGTPIAMDPVPEDIVICADPEILAASIGNLLQNAFKFTQPHTEVRLRAYLAGDRVLIDVEDRCGGLPSGAVEKMFLPFVQTGNDRSGLGLGLDISRRGVEANDGCLRVRDLPGTGCIFTIDIPRHKSV
jgi:signal transduction histidine kinase